MNKDKFIPSMFHRRLVLVLGVIVLAMFMLGSQMFKLAVVEGSARRAAAESKLDRRTYLPTTRGRVLDRQHRVIALDEASYDITVEYDVITGSWQMAQAAAEARKKVGRSKWGEMNPEQRSDLIDACMPAWQAKSDRLWAEIRKAGNLTPEALQRKLDAIKTDVQTKAAAVWEQQFLRERELFGTTEKQFQALPIREQSRPHVILPRVTDAVAFEFKRLLVELPDMFVVASTSRREYPWMNAEVPLPRNSLPRTIRHADPVSIKVAGVADHILGAVRSEVWAEDIKRRPFFDAETRQPKDFGGYDGGNFADDMVGTRGIERVFEDVLRGTRGMVNERRDSNERKRIEAEPGKDVHLTIDIALQARIQALLTPEYGLTKVQNWQNNTVLPQGMALNSAAVVIEVESGEILAMVSMPTLAMGDVMNPLQKQINMPVVNRAAEMPYPPGSIIKPLTLAGAVKENLFTLGNSIDCRGHFFERDPTIARCWFYRERYGMGTHGPLGAEEALARSCNIFFYTLADKLGIERFSAWLGRFGLGRSLDIGLMHPSTDENGRTIFVGEGAGEIPTAEVIQKLRNKQELTFSEVILGIGQGPVTWTPVQAANSYATLARGGIIRDATLLMNDPRGSRPKRCDDLGLSRNLVDAALEGLRRSVMEDYGTGHHITYEEDKVREVIINAEKVNVWAKTGTAQAPDMPMDSNRDGVIDKKDTPLKGVDHSWFVGLVGPKDSNKPMHAIAVVVEYGGSGGRTSGPIANQIIRALQAEGYLPGDHDAPSAAFIKAAGHPEPEDDGGDE